MYTLSYKIIRITNSKYACTSVKDVMILSCQTLNVHLHDKKVQIYPLGFKFNASYFLLRVQN